MNNTEHFSPFTVAKSEDGQSFLLIELKTMDQWYFTREQMIDFYGTIAQQLEGSKQ